MYEGSMVAVRRNSKEFKMVEKLVKDYAHKHNRKQHIKLYTLKPGKTLGERILLNGLKENADVLYNISYESLLACFDDPRQKLYRQDEGQPLYFFKTSPSDNWYELPFEFSPKLKKQILSLEKA